MSSFDSIDFKVVLEDTKFYPNPVRDTDGLPHYRATIVIASEADYAALHNLVTLATFKRSLGSFNIDTFVEAGPGSHTLEVPTKRGALNSFTAVLVSFEALGSAWFHVGPYRASADWVIVTDVTP